MARDNAPEPRRGVPGPSFVRFGEQDVSVEPEFDTHAVFAPPGAPLGALAQQLAVHGDGGRRRMLMQAALRRAGFDFLCYLRMLRAGEHVMHVAWLDSWSPADWPARYCHEGFFDADPRIAAACRVEWPFSWDIDSLAGMAAAERLAGAPTALARAMNEAGIRSGVCVGIATKNPLERCVVVLSSARNGRAWISDTTAGTAYALAIGVHTFADAHAGKLLPRFHTFPLNALQHSVLGYVAEGKSDREIAALLGVPSSVVARDVRELLKLFGAQNRMQLAYIAGCIGDG